MSFRAVLSMIAIALPLVSLSVSSDSHAQSAERLKSAADEYDRGRRAYLASDFEAAAVHFENAYNDAPRAEALRNAIRARTQAKEFARAATLSALAESLYAADAPTMDLAQATLKEARNKLYQVTVACTPECGIAADGRVASHDDTKNFVFFLDPGAHDVTVSWPGDRSKITHVDAKAGGHTEITLEAPPIPPPPPTATTLPPPTATAAPTIAGPPIPPPPPPSRKPLGKIPFFIGAGLTAAGIGVTIWSGLDAQNNPGVDAVKKDCVGQGESCPTYQKGLQAQTRTNVILASTGGVALITAVIGVFFTRWSEPVPEGAKYGSISPLVDVSSRGGTVGLAGSF